ncbi:MAG: hypothetical protein GY708_15670 [Actinomycetia bacterium]|nr:hypothetical protein [Actinomycetes bacterium]
MSAGSNPAEGAFRKVGSATVASRALLVGVITIGSMREFMPYSTDADWVEEFHNRIDEIITHHEVTVIAQTDPRSKTYRRFVK